MISMNRMSEIVVSLKQTVFAMMFLMSETTTESELGPRGQVFSVCLMFIDFLQASLTQAMIHTLHACSIKPFICRHAR